jgi:hypothetical protein
LQIKIDLLSNFIEFLQKTLIFLFTKLNQFNLHSSNIQTYLKNSVKEKEFNYNHNNTEVIINANDNNEKYE